MHTYMLFYMVCDLSVMCKQIPRHPYPTPPPLNKIYVHVHGTSIGVQVTVSLV